MGSLFFYGRCLYVGFILVIVVTGTLMHEKVLARVIHGLRPGKEIKSEIVTCPAILYV